MKDRGRTWEKATASERMVRKYGNLASELGSHLLGDFGRELERGMQAYKGQRLQGRLIRAKEIASDNRPCAVGADQKIACGAGTVFKGRCDCWISLLGVLGNGTESLPVLV